MCVSLSLLCHFPFPDATFYNRKPLLEPGKLVRIRCKEIKLWARLDAVGNDTQAAHLIALHIRIQSVWLCDYSCIDRLYRVMAFCSSVRAGGGLLARCFSKHAFELFQTCSHAFAPSVELDQEQVCQYSLLSVWKETSSLWRLTLVSIAFPASSSPIASP